MVRHQQVAADDADMRLDRWFKKHFPALSHGKVEKLLRTGQVRVDGRRVKASFRLAAGQEVRLPPIVENAEIAPEQADRPAQPSRPSEGDARMLREAILFQDDRIIVINKPPGLAVQGGTNTKRHLDGMLMALRGDAPEKPRLVHRLDRDTSGVLVLARDAAAARALTNAFRARDTKKLYWAAVVGVPEYEAGHIDAALRKDGAAGRERMAPTDRKSDPDGDQAQKAQTDFILLDRAGSRISWLALMPRTGRTHQLRAHCLLMGTPILGDGKYGGRDAFPDGVEISRRLHLHARALRLRHPGGKVMTFEAPLPEHMRACWRFFGFEAGRRDAGAALFDDEAVMAMRGTMH